MFESIPKKLIGGLIGIAIILVGAYFLLGGAADTGGSLETSTSTASEETGSTGTVDTSEVVNQLNNLQSISIDPEFFNSQAFLSLEDFGVTINPQEVGRDNPFIPPSYSPSGDIIVPNDGEVEQQPVEADDGVDSSTVDDTSSNPATTTSESEGATTTPAEDTTTSSTSTEAIPTSTTTSSGTTTETTEE